MSRIIPEAHVDDENALLAYLENGNEEQRIHAICYLDDEKYFHQIWEVFMSEENRRVKGEALEWVLHWRPDFIWTCLDYLIKTNERVRDWTKNYPTFHNKNDSFISQVARRLNKLHEKGTLSL